MARRGWWSARQLVTAAVLVALIAPVQSMFEGLYCGQDNCYDVLGVTRDSAKGEISKAYRKLARKLHPDMHKSKEAKENAQDQFMKVANAYEILKDNESRADYDYMLDNPEEYYYHYYQYYRRRVAPKVDVRIVIAVTVTIISIVQYLSGWQNYKNAISYLATVPKYRLQAQDIAKEQGLLGPKRKKDRSKTKVSVFAQSNEARCEVENEDVVGAAPTGDAPTTSESSTILLPTKEELKEEEEAILRKVIEDKMDIRGGYRKPSILDILWLQLLLSPYYILQYLYWYAMWLWNFTIMRREYGEEEKEYLVRRNMKLSQGQWEALEDHDKENFMHQELWVSEKYKVWKANQEEEMKAKLSQNSRYKAYRRYMKKGGPGQMTFGPE